MSTQIVAIVGRPNVGKSTLFNRIIRRRKAIVDSESGVTRDRHYAPTEWCGRVFTILDTGGYLVDFKDDIDRGIRFQVEEAIAEADLVLLITDVHTDITVIDKTMGDILLKSRKPTIVVVNKVDSASQEPEVGAFMGLGLGEPSAVSALHGRNVGNLLDRVIELLPNTGAVPAEDASISIAILGKPNVGKSSIVNALIGKEKMLVTDIPGTTRDSVDSFIKRNGQLYRLVDTAGLRKRKKVHENIEYYSTLRTIRSLDRCQIVVIIVDAREGVQQQDLKIIDMAATVKRGIVLALNKWDLVAKDDRTYIEIERHVKEKLKNAGYIEIISTSAKTKQRLFKMIDICRSVYNEWSKRIETNRLNKLLSESIERHHPPSHRGKQVTIKYCTQTKSAPPVFTFFANHPGGIPEAYRRYLSNSIREQFGFTGVPLTLQFKKKSKQESLTAKSAKKAQS